MKSYKLKLCIKRVKDVTIEAKNQKEAIWKAKAVLDKGLHGKGVEQVEWAEYST